MATVNKNTIKKWFKNLAKPTQEQFWAWMDSYWHKDEKIPVQTIEGLEDFLTGIGGNEDNYLLKDGANLDDENRELLRERLGVGDLLNSTVDIRLEQAKSGSYYNNIKKWKLFAKVNHSHPEVFEGKAYKLWLYRKKKTTTRRRKNRRGRDTLKYKKWSHPNEKDCTLGSTKYHGYSKPQDAAQNILDRKAEFDVPVFNEWFEVDFNIYDWFFPAYGTIDLPNKFFKSSQTPSEYFNVPEEEKRALTALALGASKRSRTQIFKLGFVVALDNDEVLESPLSEPWRGMIIYYRRIDKYKDLLLMGPYIPINKRELKKKAPKVTLEGEFKN